MTTRSSYQGPDVIRIWIFADVLCAHRVRIITADAFIGSEPDNFFRVDKDAGNVIGPQSAAGSFEAELLDNFSVLEKKGAVTVARDPQVIARATHNRGHRARRCAGFHRFQGIAIVEQATVVAARLGADPHARVSRSRQGVDEITARLADYLLCFSIFDLQYAAALGARVKLVTSHREAGDL